MADGGCALDLEGFEKQLQSLFISFKKSSSSTIDALQEDRGKTFCSDFSKLVEEYTCQEQTPLPRLKILEIALCYFVRGSHLFRVGCDDVRSMLSSLALSVFELLLFFDEKDFHQEPLKHFTLAFQECHECLVRHQNVHLIQVSSCIQDGGPWANSTLQSILSPQSTIPQTEVDSYISSQLPLLLELRVRYLLTREMVIEAMALAKCCSQHPTAGQDHFFLQVYLTCLHKTSQHDRLNKEVADLKGMDAVQIICNMESEERDESIVLTVARAFLSQQLRRGDMDHLCDLVFIWSKLHMRLQTPKQVLLEEIQQLMLTATNVNSIFPFIKVILEELDKDGHQFCVELCTKALQSCLPTDVPTKSLIYKTIAGLFPNDLEMCQVCALLVFFLERTVEAFKMVFSLYVNPDQEDHAQASSVSNQVRFETLQVLKTGMHFDPEFWNHKTLRANCLDLLSETTESSVIEEIMEMWVPDYCMKEPDFHLNTYSSSFQPRTKVAGPKRRRTDDDKNHKTVKRFKGSSEASAVDHSVKKKGRPPKSSMKKASTEYLRQCFWQLGKTQEDSQVHHRLLIRLSEKNPPNRNMSNLQWILEDPDILEQCDRTKLRPNIFFFVGDMPYLYTSLSPVASNGASAKSQNPQTSGAQDSHKEDPLNMMPAVVLNPLPRQMVRDALSPPAPQQQCSSGEDEDDSAYDSNTSCSKEKKDERKKGRKLKEDATSKTRTLQANTNVFFLLDDMPYLYTSVSPVAPKRPAAKSQHPQTSRAQDSHRDPLNMERVVVHTKLNSHECPLNMERPVLHTKANSLKDTLNVERPVVHTILDSQKDQLTILDSQKDQLLNMEPAVVLIKLDSPKDPLNVEQPVIVAKLDSHTDLLNMGRVVVHTKLDSHTDPLNLEPTVVHTKLDSHTDLLNMGRVVVHTKLDSHTDPSNLEPTVVHTKLDSHTDPPNLEPTVVHTKLDSHKDPPNLEPTVVHTKLHSHKEDPLKMMPAVHLTSLPLAMVRPAPDPPAPQQQLSSVEEAYEDSVYESDTWDQTDGGSDDSDWMEYGSASRRRIQKKSRTLNGWGPVKMGEWPRLQTSDQSRLEGMRVQSYPFEAFACSECPNAYTSEVFLFKHLRRSHNMLYHQMLRDGEIPISQKQEDTDGEPTSYSHRLSTIPIPMRTYKTKKPQGHKCSYCFKIFKTFYRLKSHQIVHTGERSFQCDQCDKSFSVLSNLRRHKSVHTGIKPFQCKVCDKRFSQLGSLKIHERGHTGIKPFPCLLCDSSFNCKTSLRSHQGSRHGL